MIYQGDCLQVLKTLELESIDCCITSPPYWGLRDYGTAKWDGGDPECDHIQQYNSMQSSKSTLGGREPEQTLDDKRRDMNTPYKELCGKCGAKRIDAQLGLEKTPEEYVAKMVEVFREVKRVLKKEGTLWLNLGDSYAGSGRGLAADGTWNPGKGGSKQETNVGAIIGRQVNSKSLSKNLIKKGVIGNAWVKPPEGYRQKNLIGIPWRVAFVLQQDGWYLRQDIIWAKPNPMPESVTDRCTKSHEYIFLLAKSQKYYFDNEAIKEPTSDMNTKPRSFRKSGADSTLRNDTANGYIPRPDRNKRSVWTITTKPFKGAHFATFPEDLIEPMVKAGCPKNGVVLDPFFGAGTTGVVAKKLGRNFIGIELNPEYIKMAEKRITNTMDNLY